MPAFTFRALIGSTQYDLPDFQGTSFAYDFSDVAAFKGVYPEDGVNADRLVEDTIIIVFWNGIELLDSRYWIQAGEDDDDVEEGYFTVHAKSILDSTRRTIVIPPAGAASMVVSSANAGGILQTFIQAAQARGALTNITWDFTNTLDSAGVPWSQIINLEYKYGVNLLEVIHNLVDNGMLEVRFDKYKLQAFNGDGMGVDRTIGATPIVLQAGLDYEELPRKWSTENRAKFSGILGDNDTIVETLDNTVPNGPFGREEMAISQSGTTDVGTLTIVNQAALDKVKIKREQLTRKVKIREGGPIPGVDYRVSDFIYERVPRRSGASQMTDTDRYRIRSLVIETGEAGLIGSASITLNDKFLEAQIKLARKVTGIIGGGAGEGGSGIPSSEPGTDTTTPNAPSSLILSSTTYLDSSGRARGILTADWNPPTLNTDGTALTDLRDYEVQYKLDTDTLWKTTFTTTDYWSVGDLDVNKLMNVRVRAWDNAGHASTFAVANFTVAQDTTAPSIASKPIITVSRGTVQVAWDGLAGGGGGMEADFSHLEVYRSQTSNFTLAQGTLVGRLFAKGVLTIPDQAYGVTWYYRFASLDTSGNRSGLSVQESAVTSQLVGGDLANQSIAYGHMQANSVDFDTVRAGAIDVHHLMLGVLRTNLVNDPSFEEDYTFSTYAAGQTNNMHQWRAGPATNGFVSRVLLKSRSGAWSADLYTNPGGGSVQLYSAAMPVKSGKTYKLLIPVIALGAVSPTLGVTVYQGTVPETIGTTVSQVVANAVASVPISSSYPVNPNDFVVYTAEFTPTQTWAMIRIQSTTTGEASLCVDDVSVVEEGIGGATEITSAGIRLFDDKGNEVGAFVSNRPNYFSVFSQGNSVASISNLGAAKFLSVNSDKDLIVGGTPLLGKMMNWDPPMTEGGLVTGHLDKIGRGLVGFGNLPNNAFTGTSYQRELSFIAEPGRSYEVTYGGGQVQLSLANTSMGVYLGYCTPATDGGDASGVGAVTYRHNYTTVDTANQQVGLKAMSFILRCNKNGLAAGGELRAGRNRIKIGVHASTGTLTVNQLHDFYVKDVGADIPDSDIANTASTGSSAATQTYTTRWRCDNSEAYDGSNNAITSSTDLMQGVHPTWGDRFSLLLFGGNGFEGEAVPVSTAMSGAAIVRARVFIYFKHWEYPSGGNVSLFANTLTGLINTRPSGVGYNEFMDTQSGGRWFDITSLWDTTKRGIWMGPAITTAFHHNVTAASHVDALDQRPILEITYRK